MKQKKFSRVIWGGLLFLLLYVCYMQMERSELNNVHIVQLFSIDKTNENYQVSALYDDNGGNSESGINIADGIGNTVYSAFVDMQKKSNRELSIAHTAYYLVSDAVVKKDLESCLDFITREQNTKDNASLYILKQNNINNLLKTSTEDKNYFHESLSAITQKESDQLKKVDNTILTIQNKLEEKSNNLIIPYLLYTDDRLYPNGYAAFRDNTLYGYLDYNSSEVINLFRNQLTTYSLFLNETGIELSNIHVNTLATYENDKLHVEVKFKSAGEIKEVNVNKNVFDKSQLADLEKQSNNALKDMFLKIISFCKETGIDLFDFEDLTGVTIPNKSKVLKDMTVDFTIQTDLAKNYLLEN